MTTEIVDALSTDDAKPTSKSKFYAEYKLTADDFHIEVANVGRIKLPINEKNIKKLLAVAKPAKFGLREKTLLDKKVRDTHEIVASKLQIKYNQTSFTKMLSKITKSMGLSANAKLVPHLHNMLIYGPGQFFKKHQDSEKLNDMVASLVIVLPSPHIGGDLIINHLTKQYTFTAEGLGDDTVKCIAFYTDCQHEVEKIKQGYRVTLTYNLVLESEQNQLPIKTNPQLEKALNNYFNSNTDTNSRPLKLVYFLDHSYTEYSLKWHMLKGIDSQNALSLRSAAKNLGLIPHIALVELHECWSTGDQEQSWYADYDSSDEYDEADKSDLDELLDSSTTFSYWLDENNQKLPYGNLSIQESETCWTKDTDDCSPSKTEHEGWMGNYGNTVDYWYRRAAILLWREDDQCAMNFLLNYTDAIQSLVKLTKSKNNEVKVLKTIKQVGKCLTEYPNNHPAKYFSYFAQIACYIKKHEVAKSILTNFTLEVLDIKTIKYLVTLQNIYGIDWCIKLMTDWVSINNRDSFYSDSMLENISKLTPNMVDLGMDLKLVEFLLQHELNVIIEDNKRYKNCGAARLIDTLKDRMNTLKFLLNACCVLKNSTMMKHLADYLIANKTLYPEIELAAILLEYQKWMRTTHFSIYELLRDRIVTGMREELNAGLRDDNDWSIKVEPTCNCNNCKIATTFLRSKTESKKIWPLIMQAREHIINIFNNSSVPVNFSVEKTGSPHKLIMVKSNNLHQVAKQRYNKLQTYYKKLGVSAVA